MQLSPDERAQPVQIGFILVFAIIIISFSLYQATVVPDENAEVEFEHSQAVERDMASLRNDIVRAANGGVDGVAQVQLGTSYPSRSLAVNAGPASGTIRTTGLAELGVYTDSALNSGDRVDVCPNGDLTQSVVYEPSYNYYDNAPTTIYENTGLFNRFQQSGGPTETVETAPRLVFNDEKLLNLVSLWGNVSESRSGTASFDVFQGEVQEQNVTGNFYVVLPTQAETIAPWQPVLDSPDVNLDSFEPDNDRIVLEITDEYTVFCTEVGFGEAPPSGIQSLAPPARSGGTGGDSPSQNGIQYNDGLETTSSDSAVQFDIENVGGSSATVTAVRVDERIGAVEELWKRNAAVVAVRGGRTDGNNETGGSPAAARDTNTVITLDTNAVLSTSGSGSTATVFVGDFGDATTGGGPPSWSEYNFNGLTRVSQSDNWDIRITLEFDSRGDVTYYFQET
ncbi:hypothetical protein [Natronomonas sp. EA1]|uniref:hypothetical protein n=1 Tax=Natronomonas sp. EA1 TaxID=3421655 RepID=UPI003EBFDEED